MTSTTASRWMALSVKRPRLTLLAFVVVTAGALFVSRGLVVDFRPSAVFLDDDDDARAFHAYQDRWGQDDMMVAVIVESRDGSVLTNARLQTIHRVAESLRPLPTVKSVRGLQDLPIVGPDDDGALTRRPLREIAARDDDAVRLRRHVDDAFGAIPALLSEDAHTAVVVVEPDFKTDDMSALKPFLDEIDDALTPFHGREGLKFHIAGVPAARAAFLKLTVRDQRRLVPLALLCIAVLLFVVFRRVSGVVIPALAAFAPVVMLTAIMAATGEPVGLVNQLYFTLIPALAVADAIHLVHRFFHEEQAHPDLSRRENMGAALKAVGPACVLTSVTTAIGFLSLGGSAIGVLRNFGIYASLGVVLAFVVVVFVVPALFLLRESRANVVDAAAVDGESWTTPTRRLERALASLTRFLIQRPAPSFLLFFSLGLSPVVVFGPLVVVDNELTSLVPDDEAASYGNRILNTRLGGILTLGIELVPLPGHSLFTSSSLAAMRDLEAFAPSVAGVRHAVGPAALYRGLNRAFIGDDEVPRTDARIAELDLVAGIPNAAPSFFQANAARIMVGTVDDGGRAVLARAHALEERGRELLAPHGVSVVVKGRPVSVYRKLSAFVLDLRTGLFLAVVAILFALLAMFRSPRLLLASIPSNVLPILVGYSTLGAFDWPLDMGPAVILTIAFGISVDDTVHVIERFRQEHARGLSVDDAIVAAVSGSGRAVVITSVVLVAGFLLQTLSSFRGIVEIGLLGAVVVAAALLADLFVLPPLLKLTHRRVS